MKKKIIMSSLGVVSIVAAPIIASVSYMAKTKDDSKSFSFQGRIFNNPEEAYTYLVRNNLVEVNSQKVVGDIARSYADVEKGLLLKDNLPDYDISDIDLAYFNAGGGLNRYNRAKETYFNPGNIAKKYDDGFGNKFLSVIDAQNSMKENSMINKIGYYNVNFVKENIGSITSAQKITYQKMINPFNSKDVEKYKNNIKDNIDSIIGKYLKDPTGSSYDVLLNKHDRQGAVNAQIPSIKLYFNDVLNKLGVTSSQKYSVQQINDQLSSKWKTIGDWQWNDDHEEEHPYTVTSFKATNYGDRWTWTSSDRFSYEMSLDKMASALHNLGGSEWITSSDSKQNFVNDLETRSLLNDLKTYVNDKIESLRQDDKLFMSIFGSLKFLNSPILRSIYRDTLIDGLKRQCANILNNKDNTKFRFTSMPDLEVDAKNSGGLGINNDIKIVDKEYPFQYKETLDVPFFKQINIYASLSSSSNNKEVKELNYKIFKLADPSNGNNDLEVTIKDKNSGRSLFDIDISAEKSLIAKSAKISDDNRKDFYSLDDELKTKFYHKSFEKIFPTSTQLSNDRLKEDYLLYCYHLFIEEIKKAKSASKDSHGNILNISEKVKDVYDHYFGIGGLLSVVKSNINFKYDVDFDHNKIRHETEIDKNNLMRFYLKSLDDVYEKYKNQEELLLLSTKALFIPENLLIVNKKGKNDLKLAKYNVRSITDINAPLVSGGFHASDPKNVNVPGNLATTLNEWNNIKNDINFNPALILIAYNNNGKEINSGNYQYDGETILEYNAKLNIQPRRDYDHIFLNSYSNGPILNQVSTIYSLKMEGLNKHWFKTKNDLKSFMIQFIKDHADYL